MGSAAALSRAVVLQARHNMQLQPSQAAGTAAAPLLTHAAGARALHDARLAGRVAPQHVCRQALLRLSGVWVLPALARGRNVRQARNLDL